MKYFFDTEFVEDGVTIMPLSLGIVSEDGREGYWEVLLTLEEMLKALRHPFVSKNVLPHMGKCVFEVYMVTQAKDIMTTANYGHTIFIFQE